jgi:hypothetical protein
VKIPPLLSYAYKYNVIFYTFTCHREYKSTPHDPLTVKVKHLAELDRTEGLREYVRWV